MSMQKGFTLIELIRLVHALKIVKLLLLLRSSFYRLVQIELNEENIQNVSFFLQKEKEKQGADSSLDSMIVCRADKTSSRHLFLLPKSFVYTVCHSLSQRQNRISLSKTFFLLVIFLSERKCSVFSLSLFIVIVFPTLSYLSPCLLSDYYSTNKNIECIDTRQVTVNDNERIRASFLHVDGRMSLRVLESVCVLSSLFNIYKQNPDDFH